MKLQIKLVSFNLGPDCIRTVGKSNKLRLNRVRISDEFLYFSAFFSKMILFQVLSFATEA